MKKTPRLPRVATSAQLQLQGTDIIGMLKHHHSDYENPHPYFTTHSPPRGFRPTGSTHRRTP
jgi:hypothetical protein